MKKMLKRDLVEILVSMIEVDGVYFKNRCGLTKKYLKRFTKKELQEIILFRNAALDRLIGGEKNE